MAKKVIDNFGTAAVLPPSVATRNWIDVIFVAAICFAIGTFLGLALLWRPLPGLPMPPAGLLAYISGFFKLAAHGIAPFLFHDGAMEMQQHLRYLAETGMSTPLYARFSLALCFGGLVAFVVGKSAATPTDRLMHMEGRQMRQGKEAVQRAKSVMAPQIKIDGGDYWIHKDVQLTANFWRSHGVLIGAPGSGKTTVLMFLIHQIFKRNDKAFFHDIKGDITAKFPKARLFAPWDARGEPWLVGRDVTDITSATEFSSCIKDSKDPMWSAAAKQVLVGLIVDLQQRKGVNWGWRDLYDQFSRTDEADLEELMMRCNPIGVKAVVGAQQTTSGIMINMTAELSWVAMLAMAWGNPDDTDSQGRPLRKGGISLLEWLMDEKPARPQIILVNNGRYTQMVRGYSAAMMSLLTSRVNSPEFEDSRSRIIWFILDEFPQMGQIDFEAFVETGRSKGIRFWAGFQDINQIIKVYQKEVADSLMSMVGTKIICQVSPGATSKSVHELIGGRSVERTDISVSGSGQGKSTNTSISRHSVDIMHISELSTRLGNKPELGGILALYLSNASSDVFELVWEYDKTPNHRPPYVPADWVKAPPVSLRSPEEEYGEALAEEEDETKGRLDNQLDMQGAQTDEQRRMAEEAEEYRQAAIRAANRRFELLKGKSPPGAIGIAKREPSNDGGVADKSIANEFADIAVGAAGAALGLSVSGASASPAQKAAADIERDHIRSTMDLDGMKRELLAAEDAEEELSLPEEAHHAMESGEHIGHAMGLDHHGQQALGAVMLAGTIADELAAKPPTDDPIEIRRRYMQIEQSRGRATSLRTDWN